MSEPTIERPTLEERLRQAADVESCPRLLLEAADAIAVLARRRWESQVCMCGQWSCRHETPFTASDDGRIAG